MNVGRLLKAALKNPPAFGAVAGGVAGLILGLIAGLLFHQLSLVTWLVLGLIVGAALGWWQHRLIAARVAKLLLGRISPL